MGTITQPHLAYNTANATDSVTVSMGAYPVENPCVLNIFVFYNGLYDGVTTYVQSVQIDGVDADFLIYSTALGPRGTIELWQIDVKSLASYSMTNCVVTFPGGSSFDILAAVLDFPMTQVRASPSVNFTDSGATSPATSSIDWSGGGVNISGSVVAPVEQYMHGFAFIAFKGVDTPLVSLSSAPAGYNEQLPVTNVGSSPTAISCGIVVVPANASSTDTVEWSMSVNVPWATLCYEHVPTAVLDVIRPQGIIPPARF